MRHMLLDTTLRNELLQHIESIGNDTSFTASVTLLIEIHVLCDEEEEFQDF